MSALRLIALGALFAPTALAMQPEPSGDPAAVSAPANEVAPAPTAVPETVPAAPAEPAAEPASPPVPKGVLDRWTTFVRGELDHILATYPYGATFQLPQGYLKVGYKWSSLHGDSRFDDTGKLGPVIPPLVFQLGGKPQLDVDFGVSGHGGSHTFSFGYGITDHLSWFANIPFNYLSVSTNLQVNTIDDQGNHIGATAASLLGVTDRKNYGPANFLYQTLPQLGRPVLGSSFRGAWLLGDVDTGVAWNFFRTPVMSSAITGRVWLPTAHVPSSNSNILFATGTEIQVGTGGWGVGATQGYDVRVFKAKWLEVVLGSELSVNYHFAQQRAYPTNFIKPDPQAAGLSPTAFPDLSQLSGNFTLTPGWGVGVGGRIDVTVAIFGVSVGYGFGYAQKPSIVADPAFVGMVDALGLLGESEAQNLAIVGGVSLIPFAIPARITFGWQRVLFGRNVLLFQDNYTLGIEGYIPTLFWLKR